MGVATEVAEHALGPREGWLGVDDPVALAKRVQQSRQRIVGAKIAPMEALSECIEKLGAEDLRECAHGEEEARVSHGDPARAIGGQGAAGDPAVQVGMKRNGLAPGVEDGRDAEVPAEVLRIPREGLERLARGAKQQVVDDAGLGQGEPAELVRQREDDVEVGDGKQIGASGFEPILLGEALALRAVAVATGVVDGAPVAAAVTRLEVTPEGGGAAGREGAQDPVMEWRDLVGGAEVGSMPTQDLSEVRRGLGPCRSRTTPTGLAHGGSARQEVERLRYDPHGLVGRLHEMEVASRRPQTPVPQEALQGVEVDAGFEQVAS